MFLVRDVENLGADADIPAVRCSACGANPGVQRMSILRKLSVAGWLTAALIGAVVSTAGPAHAAAASSAAAANGRLVIACNCECSW